jgi:MFS family permease
MNPDFWCYVAQFVAAVVYALIAELALKRRYEPNYTWAMGMWGIGQVGLIVAARLAWAPLPALFQAELVWWVWWLIFWSFVAAAFPIVGWQLAMVGRRWRQVAAAWERWNSRGRGDER